MKIADDTLSAVDELIRDHGLTVEEAARNLGLSAKTVSRQLRRWRARQSGEGNP